MGLTSGHLTLILNGVLGPSWAHLWVHCGLTLCQFLFEFGLLQAHFGLSGVFGKQTSQLAGPKHRQIGTIKNSPSGGGKLRGYAETY